MKTFYLLLFVGIVGLASQVHGQTPAAQSTLDSDRARLEKKMDEMRKAKGADAYDPEGIANRAASELKMFKGRHPEQDVAAYEKEIQNFKKSLAEEEADEAESDANAEGFEEAYEEAMSEAYSSLNLRPRDGSDGAVASAQAESKRIIGKIDEFLGSDEAQGASELDPESISSVMQDLANAYAELEGRLPGLKAQMTEGTDRRYTTGAFLEMQVLERFWKANGTLFPSNAEVKDAISKVAALHREVGTMESIEAARAKNETARIAAVRMEPAKVHDANIEAEMKRVYLASRWGAGANVIKVNLTTSTWTTVNHKITGKLAGRYIDNCTIVYKDQAGNCWTDRVGLWQDYSGSGYAGSRPYYTYDQKARILCEHVK